MNERDRLRVANDYIVGYANGFITDQECSEMCDLILNESSIVTEDDWCHYSGMPSPEAYK